MTENLSDAQVIDRFRSADGSILGPMTCYGDHANIPPANKETLTEIAYLLRSVLECEGRRFRLLSLGAAPGDWAARAQRAYEKAFGRGDYMSVCVEADLNKIRMMEHFFKTMAIDQGRNIIVYAAVAPKPGWAHFPIAGDNDWGCYIVGLTGDDGSLEHKINVPAGNVAAGAGKDIQSRGVMAMTLAQLLAQTGPVDYLHSDVQGTEADIFPADIEAVERSAKYCCISTHARKIDATLPQFFEGRGWHIKAHLPAHCVDGPHGEECHGDGILIVRNPSQP